MCGVRAGQVSAGREGRGRAGTWAGVRVLSVAS